MTPEPPAILAEPASRGDLTRMAIMDAGYHLFAQNGYHGTSMRKIAEQVGIAPSAIYNHFDGKEPLFAAVLDAYHPYRKVLQAMDEAQGETVEALVRDVGTRVRQIVGDSAFQLLPLVFIEIVEFQGRHVKQLAEAILPRVTAFAARFQKSRGALRPIPLPTMMLTLLSLLIAARITETLFQEWAGLPADRPAGNDEMLSIYLHGVLAPEAGE